MLLADQSARRVSELRDAFSFVSGQLLTPLSRYAPWAGVFAVDNGGFSGADPAGFLRMLDRLDEHRENCLFVAVPDVPGDARRTAELFEAWEPRLRSWPLALVAQDGIERESIPWASIRAVFIGGTDRFKDGPGAEAVVRAAKWMGKHVHIGRVNTPRRWAHFDKMGADTCDGSGVSRYDWMLERIDEHLRDTKPLLEAACGE